MTKKDLLHRAIEEATNQEKAKEQQEIRSILMLTFQSGVRVRAYAPFLEIGQVRQCEAVIYSDLSGEYHSYKGTATVGYDANNAFLARLKDGRETYLSIGTIGACHWNEKDRLDLNKQTIHANKIRVWRDKEQRPMSKQELTKMLKPTKRQLHDQAQTRLYQERHGKEQEPCQEQ